MAGRVNSSLDKAAGRQLAPPAASRSSITASGAAQSPLGQSQLDESDVTRDLPAVSASGQSAGSSGPQAPRTPLEHDIWRLLSQVPDPEIPVLDIVALGIIRYVRVQADPALPHAGSIHVGVSPTYTGCPATEVIQAAIRGKLIAAGHANVHVDTVLFPPWSSEWLTDGARARLAEYGIAPPAHAVSRPRHLCADPAVRCPRCASIGTRRVSEFGSTPCKALYQCLACREPFEYFKCI